MSRCRACDQAFAETEFKWRKDTQTWEDLCHRCLSVVYTDPELLRARERSDSEVDESCTQTD